MDFDLDSLEREIQSAANFYLDGLTPPADPLGATLLRHQGPLPAPERPPPAPLAPELDFSYGDMLRSAAGLAEGEEAEEAQEESEAELFFASEIDRERQPELDADSLAEEPAPERRRSVRFEREADEEHTEDAKAAWASSLRESEASPRRRALLGDKSDMYDAMARRRQAREEAETEGCTFQPSLAPGTYRALGLARGEADPAATAQRLFSEADEREVLRLCTKYHLEEAELAQFSFQPRIAPKSERLLAKGGSYVPIHLRSAQVQRAKATRLRAKEAELGANHPDLTFHPQIDPASERMARKRSQMLFGVEGPREVLEEDAPVSSPWPPRPPAPEDLEPARRPHPRKRVPPVAKRLAAEAKAAQARKEIAIAAREEQLASERRSVPRITERSGRIAEKSSLYRLPFEQRQEVLEAKRAQRAQQRRAERAERENSWYSPNLASTTERILEKSRRPQHQARRTETATERVHRLSVGDAKRIAEARRAAQEEQERALSFQPKIDPVSRRLAASASDVDRFSNVRGQRTRQRSEDVARLRFLEEHSFQPQLETAKATRDRSRVATGPTSGAVESSDAFAKTQQYKEAQRQRERADREILEMRECTFKPQIKPLKPAVSGKPVVVRGLGRHLELRDMAKRQKAEQEERERRAFGGKDAQRVRCAAGITIQAPFQLSAPNARRRQRAVAEAEQRLAEECTFEPYTLERANREAILALLTEPSPYEVSA